MVQIVAEVRTILHNLAVKRTIRSELSCKGKMKVAIVHLKGCLVTKFNDLLFETDTYKLRCASCETTLAIDDRICCYTVGGMRFVDSDAFIGMTVQQIIRNMQILLHAAGIMHIIACRQEIIVGAKGCPASQIVVGVLN